MIFAGVITSLTGDADVPMVAFFPWFNVGQELRLGPIDLLPWQRTERPFGPATTAPNEALQGVLDAVLGPFFTPYREPVTSATVVTVQGRTITDDLNDD